MSSSLWVWFSKLTAATLLALQLHTGGTVALTFDQFMRGIAAQESGGSYSADNGIAVGKYQVLKSNVPEWSRQALGYSISWQTFLNSPSLQEQIVRYKLQRMFNAYGPRGAAAEWYSGDPNLDMNTAPQKGGPSIKDYVDQVLEKAGGSAGTSDTSYSSTSDVTVTPQLNPTELAEQFGFTSSFLNANPDVKKIFEQMVSQSWSKDMFQAKLRGTKWWTTHSDKERQYLLQTFTDPATARQNYAQAKTQVQQLAAQLGVTLTDFVKKQLSVATYNLVAKGWSEGQLRQFLGQYAYFGNEPGGTFKGQGADVQNELRTYAYSMGVTMHNMWYADNTRKVLEGLATTSDFKHQILQQAKAMFPQFAKQLDGGQTVADIASPYLQSMSKILELPEGSINLFDPTIKSALQYKNPSSLQTEGKPLWQFENDLRNDPRWKQTKNAQDSLFQVGHQVLSDFGFKY